MLIQDLQHFHCALFSYNVKKVAYLAYQSYGTKYKNISLVFKDKSSALKPNYI